MNKNDIIIGGSSYDVEDINRYDYLEPIWDVLNNTPEKGITSKQLFEQTHLDENRSNKLVKELMNEFQSKFMHDLTNPVKMIFKFSKKDFYEKNLSNCWAWDKMMLLATRIDTGQPHIFDTNPIMLQFKQKWIEQRGDI